MITGRSDTEKTVTAKQTAPSQTCLTRIIAIACVVITIMLIISIFTLYIYNIQLKTCTITSKIYNQNLVFGNGL